MSTSRTHWCFQNCCFVFDLWISSVCLPCRCFVRWPFSMQERSFDLWHLPVFLLLLPRGVTCPGYGVGPEVTTIRTLMLSSEERRCKWHPFSSVRPNFRRARFVGRKDPNIFGHRRDWHVTSHHGRTRDGPQEIFWRRLIESCWGRAQPWESSQQRRVQIHTILYIQWVGNDKRWRKQEKRMRSHCLIWSSNPLDRGGALLLQLWLAFDRKSEAYGYYSTIFSSIAS